MKVFFYLDNIPKNVLKVKKGLSEATNYSEQ